MSFIRISESTLGAQIPGMSTHAGRGVSAMFSFNMRPPGPETPFQDGMEGYSKEIKGHSQPYAKPHMYLSHPFHSVYNPVAKSSTVNPFTGVTLALVAVTGRAGM